MNPIVLAFVGDSVQQLYVRTKLSLLHTDKSGSLHKMAVLEVKATAQAQAADTLLPLLTEEEAAVYRRGRNGKTPSVAKNASVGDYHKASGLESLFGYLYLTGKTERLAGLLKAAYEKEQ